MIDYKDVTIVIPHLGGNNESEYSLGECLKSLEETAPRIKILVANNGIGCVSHVNRADIRIKDQGQCKAVNAAVAMTDTPWVFVTNDDMIYPPGWFEKLTTSPIWKPDNCISPKLIEPHPGAPTFEVFFAGGAGGDFDKQKWLEFANNYQGQGRRTGFNLPFLISRKVWDLVGGYDINYDPWGSNGDSDLEYKIKLLGVQPVQNTDSIVYHFSQTSGTFTPENDSYRFRNYAYFKEKWGFDRTDNGIWEATFNIPTKEEGRIFNPDWEGKYGRS